MRTIALLMAAATAVFGQVEQATIAGSVTDQSGAVVPGARITATNTRTAVVSETQSNAEGQYRLPYLPAGEYEVAVEKDGFNKSRVAAINLTVGLTATVNVILTAGSLQQEVTVTASAVQLEQENSS